MNKASEILSDITVHMKYAKYIPELKRREEWIGLVDRNKAMHIKKFPDLTDQINTAYTMVYDKKVLPSMRSMQFAGKPIEISPNRLYNCSYLPIDHIDSFSESMFLLLSGCGVGFSVQRHHVDALPYVLKPFAKRERRFVIGDSIEGWADAIKVLIKSYIGNNRTSHIKFDFSDIRPKGALLVTSGGKAPGPQPLKECIMKIEGILSAKEDGGKLTTIETYDIICHIADAVLAGGIRRAALIALFSADDEEMISCKSGNWWELNPQRGRSNNSVVLMRHKVTKDFFMDIWKRIELSGAGEPGIYLNNDKDWGTNPCCIIGDTHVGVADGREPVKMIDLVKEGKDVPVYTINESGKLDIEVMRNPRLVKSGVETYRVNFTNGSNIIVDGSHVFIMKDGSEKGPLELVNNDILESLDVHGGSTQLSEIKERVQCDAGKQNIRNNANSELARKQLKVEWPVTYEAGTYFVNKPCEYTGELMKLIWNKRETSFSSQLSQSRYKSKQLTDRILCNKNKESRSIHNVVLSVIRAGVANVYSGTVPNTHTYFAIGTKQEDKAGRPKYSMVLNRNCEIALRPYQFCNLCEVNVSNIESQEDLNERVKAATFIGTLQAAYTDFHYLREIWKETTERDALIGISMTGIGSGEVLKYDMKKAASIVKRENTRVAKILGINPAARTTCVKPAGCLTPNTKIRTNIGNITMEEIFEMNGYSMDDVREMYREFLPLNEKIHIYNEHNEKEPITKLFVNGIDDTFDITFEDGLTVSATKDHRFLTTNRGWVRAEDLIDSDYIFSYRNKTKDRIMKIKSITKSTEKRLTLDLEVNGSHTYQLANNTVVHNTTSLTLGTSSGIHAWHNDYYIRRLRVGKNEAIYSYLFMYHNELIEDDYFRPHDTAVISIPQMAPKNAILRTESPTDLLERIKRVAIEWVKTGHRTGSNGHNVSATVSLKDDEWADAGEWMWENRKYYNGLSVLPYDGGTYIQAPFEDITEEKYNELMKSLVSVDLTKVIELEDNTDQSGEIACSGGSCIVTDL